MEPATTHPPDKDPTRIEGMFDAIARRYDLLNRVLSAGRDRRWRARAVRSLALTPEAVVLDGCTGTAEIALAVAASGPARRVIGLDLAAGMLREARVKVRGAGLDRRLVLVRGDATRVPLPLASVDGVAIAFGVRNVADPASALREAYRVLRPAGRLAILEFGFPAFAPLRAAYRLYFTRLLPLIGRVVSGHRTAYRYLPDSVATFATPAAFCGLLQAAGFVAVRAVPLTAGIVYLYEAAKPDGAVPGGAGA